MSDGLPIPIPIYILEKEDGVLPEQGTYFAIGSNGAHLSIDQGYIQGLVPIELEEVSTLGPIEPRVKLNLPKLPEPVVFQCLLFFRRVYYQHKSEAALILYYDMASEEYHLHCPLQWVSGGGVRYDPQFDKREPDPESLEFFRMVNERKLLKVGTVHSHCDFGAFHSGTDVSDERYFNGLHVTIGDLAKRHFTVSSTVVLAKNRFPVAPERVLCGLVPQADRGHGRFMSYARPGHWFSISLSDQEQQEIVNRTQWFIESEWMPRVRLGMPPNWECRPPRWKRTSWERDWEKEQALQGVQVEVGDKDAQGELLQGEPPLNPDDVNSDGFLALVRRHAEQLKNHRPTLKPSEEATYLGTLRRFFKKEEITEIDIDLACQVGKKEEVSS